MSTSSSRYQDVTEEEVDAYEFMLQQAKINLSEANPAEFNSLESTVEDARSMYINAKAMFDKKSNKTRLPPIEFPVPLTNEKVISKESKDLPDSKNEVCSDEETIINLKKTIAVDEKRLAQYEKYFLEYTAKVQTLRLGLKSNDSTHASNIISDKVNMIRSTLPSIKKRILSSKSELVNLETEEKNPKKAKVDESIPGFSTKTVKSVRDVKKERSTESRRLFLLNQPHFPNDSKSKQIMEINEIVKEKIMKDRDDPLEIESPLEIMQQCDPFRSNDKILLNNYLDMHSQNYAASTMNQKRENEPLLEYYLRGKKQSIGLMSKEESELDKVNKEETSLFKYDQLIRKYETPLQYYNRVKEKGRLYNDIDNDRKQENIEKNNEKKEEVTELDKIKTKIQSFRTSVNGSKGLIKVLEGYLNSTLETLNNLREDKSKNTKEEQDLLKRKIDRFHQNISTQTLTLNSEIKRLADSEELLRVHQYQDLNTRYKKERSEREINAALNDIINSLNTASISKPIRSIQ